VRSIFSYNDIAEEMSPFLLMDYAGPADFPATNRKLGVGQHPHRGFETVTIVYEGGVSHRDSSGGGGTIGRGDVQWMTAASGILHEEFHSEDYARAGGPFEMVQLWVNLPAKDKMTAPRYQGVTEGEIPTARLPVNAGYARVIAGRYGDVQGPVNTFTPMNVWDLRLQGGKSVEVELPEGHTTALFVLDGELQLEKRHHIGPAEMAVMERAGSRLAFDVVKDATVLLLNGEPLNEPIVGHGPFVMNTHTEIEDAIRDFNTGQFGEMPA
jgi:redox-sensitive bicupin YhaK (pirin superfamily)